MLSEIKLMMKINYVIPRPVDQNATRIDNFLHNIHHCDSLKREQIYSRSNMVHRRDEHTNHLGSNRKDQVLSLTDIFQNFLDICSHKI